MVIGEIEDWNRLVTMRELIIDLLDLKFIVLDYLDIDWNLIFTRTVSRL